MSTSDDPNAGLPLTDRAAETERPAAQNYNWADVEGDLDEHESDKWEVDPNALSDGDGFPQKTLTVLRRLQGAKNRALLPADFVAWAAPLSERGIMVLGSERNLLESAAASLNDPETREAAVDQFLKGLVSHDVALYYTSLWPSRLQCRKAAEPFNPNIAPVINQSFISAVADFLVSYQDHCQVLDQEAGYTDTDEPLPANRYRESCLRLKGGIVLVANYRGAQAPPHLHVVLIPEALDQALSADLLQRGLDWTKQLASWAAYRVDFLANGVTLVVDADSSLEEIGRLYNATIPTSSLINTLATKAAEALPAIAQALSLAISQRTTTENVGIASGEERGILVTTPEVTMPDDTGRIVTVYFKPIEGALQFRLLHRAAPRRAKTSIPVRVEPVIRHISPLERWLAKLRKLSALQAAGLLPKGLAFWPNLSEPSGKIVVEYLLADAYSFSAAQATAFTAITRQYQLNTNHARDETGSTGTIAFDPARLRQIRVSLSKIQRLVVSQTTHLGFMSAERDDPVAQGRDGRAYVPMKKLSMVLSPGLIVLSKNLGRNANGYFENALEFVLLHKDWGTPLADDAIAAAVDHMLQLKANNQFNKLLMELVINGKRIEIKEGKAAQIITAYRQSFLQEPVLPLLAADALAALPVVKDILTAIGQPNGEPSPWTLLIAGNAFSVDVGGVLSSIGKPYALTAEFFVHETEQPSQG